MSGLRIVTRAAPSSFTSIDDTVKHARNFPSNAELAAYAAGTLGWADLRKRGVDYAAVLAGLGRLGLHPPIAPLEGTNLAARERGIARLKDLLDGSGP